MNYDPENIKDHLTWDVSVMPALQSSVRAILERPFAFEWTTQGFGMLRTYLDKDKVWRLNVWHTMLAVPGVSTIHDHPWHFKSWVLSGRMINRRFFECRQEQDRYARPFHFMKIRTGEGGGPRSEPETVFLSAKGPEVYPAPHCYVQAANEIHHTMYDDGTVTLNYRERLEDGDHARVFWPAGESWVDAEPAPAGLGVVKQITASALEKWHVADKLVHGQGLVEAEPREEEAGSRVFVPGVDRVGAGFEMR